MVKSIQRGVKTGASYGNGEVRTTNITISPVNPEKTVGVFSACGGNDKAFDIPTDIKKISQTEVTLNIVTPWGNSQYNWRIAWTIIEFY